MYSVLILAAGFSSRMKKQKALLSFNENVSFIEHIVESYFKNPACKEIVVVANKDNIENIRSSIKVKGNWRLVINPYPEKERFYSIQCGLKALKFKESVFIHNVDNPFVSQTVIGKLIKFLPQGDFCVPEYQKHGGHPILLSGKVVAKIINEDDYKQNLKNYLKKFKKIYVPVNDKNVLVNINNWDDYRQIFKQAK